MTTDEPRRGPSRPGAMTTAMRALGTTGGPSALRVAILRGGKILHDRLLRDPQKVSLGTKEDNTFVLGGTGLPKALVLLEPTADAYRLCLVPGMTGRISSGEGEHDLAELSASARARGVSSIRLAVGARGKLSVAELTVLFEWVSAPARPLRPELPMAVRGSFVKSIDWLFTAFVITSFLSHFGFVVYLESADWPLRDDEREQIEHAAKLLIEAPDLPAPDPLEPVPSPSNDARAPEKQADSQIPSPAREHGRTSAKDPSSSPAVDRATLTAEAIRSAENLMLGALGSEGGALFDVLKGGAVTEHAEDLFAAVESSTIATTASTGLIDVHRAQEGTRTGDLGALARQGEQTGPVKEGHELSEAKVHGRIDTGEPEEEGGTGELDGEDVTREIKRRLGAIRSCYEQALRHDASLAGKLTVRFRVEQSGTFSHVNVAEDSVGDAAFAACVTRVVGGMRLMRGPEGGSVDFSYPFVFKSDR